MGITLPRRYVRNQIPGPMDPRIVAVLPAVYVLGAEDDTGTIAMSYMRGPTGISTCCRRRGRCHGVTCLLPPDFTWDRQSLVDRGAPTAGCILIIVAITTRLRRALFPALGLFCLFLVEPSLVILIK